jgi:hypothetical protein
VARGDAAVIPVDKLKSPLVGFTAVVLVFGGQYTNTVWSDPYSDASAGGISPIPKTSFTSRWKSIDPAPSFSWLYRMSESKENDPSSVPPSDALVNA